MIDDTWLDHCPRARPELLVSAGSLRGARRIHLVKDLAADRSFEIGEKEHFIVSRLNGRTSLRAIGDDYAGHFGRRLNGERWTAILQQLHARSFLIVDPAHAAVAAKADPTSTPVRRSTLLRGDLSLTGDTVAAVERIHHAVRWGLSPWAVLPLVGVLVAMEVMLLSRRGELLDLLGDALRDPLTDVLLVLTLWLSAAAHELAHGVVARRFGGIVTGFGIRWRLPVLFLYCRVDNYLFIRRRWHRIATALAGTYANLLVLLPFLVAWLTWDAPDGVSAYLGAVLVLGSLLGLGNLIPIAPLDGYAALSHALGICGLAAESRAFTAVAGQRLAGRGPGIAAYPRWARVAYLGYWAGSTLLVLGLAVAVVLIARAALPESWGGWRIAVPIVLIVTAYSGAAAASQFRRSPG